MISIDGQAYQAYVEEVNAYQKKVMEAIASIKDKVEPDLYQELNEKLPTPPSASFLNNGENVPIQGGNTILPGGTVIEPAKIVPQPGIIEANPVQQPTPIPYASTPEP